MRLRSWALATVLVLALVHCSTAQLGDTEDEANSYDSPFATEAELEHLGEARDLVASGHPEQAPLDGQLEGEGDQLAANADTPSDMGTQEYDQADEMAAAGDEQGDTTEERDMLQGPSAEEQPEDGAEQHDMLQDAQAEEAEEYGQEEGDEQRDMLQEPQAEEDQQEQLEDGQAEDEQSLDMGDAADAGEGEERDMMMDGQAAEDSPLSSEDEEYEDTTALIQLAHRLSKAAADLTDPRVTKARRSLAAAQSKRKEILNLIDDLKGKLNKRQAAWRAAMDRAQFLKGQASSSQRVREILSKRLRILLNAASRNKDRLQDSEKKREAQAKALQQAYSKLIDAERALVIKSYALLQAKRRLGRAVAAQKARSAKSSKGSKPK